MPMIRRIGIVGAGKTSPAHIRALRRLSDIDITGILDTDLRAAREIAVRYGIPRHFNDPDRFYDSAKPQLIHVVTPPHTHEEVATQALGRGVHVLVEKPPSLTVRGCDALQSKAAAAELTIGVNENFAFDPRIVAARAAIADGHLGTLVHIAGFFGFDAGSVKADLSNWSWAKELPGGILEDLLPHPLTVARALADQELQLEHSHVVRTGRLPFLLDDEMRLLLTGNDGLTVDIAMSLSTHPADFIMTVSGTRATLRIDLRNMLVQLWRDGSGPRLFARGLRVTGSGLQVLTQAAHNAIGLALFRAPRPGDPVHLIRIHYDALQKGREIPTPIARARSTVKIARQIWPYGNA
jgi:predicted dehydrogenase